MAISRGFADAAPIEGGRTPAVPFHQGLSLLLLLCVLGLFIGLALLHAGGNPRPSYPVGATAALFAGQDVWWFGGLIIALIYLRARMKQPIPPDLSRLVERYWPTRLRIGLHTVAVAAIVLVVATIGAYWTGHQFGFLAVERAATFQAIIHRQGELMAAAAPDWLAFGAALTPHPSFHDPALGVWGSSRPLAFAAIRAAFSLGGVEFLTSAAWSALSVVLIVAVARRLWPERNDLAIVAALLLATTPQFLAAGMTGAAWSAQLCFNLLWLLLYLRGRVLGHLAAAFVGIAATLLDQIQVHIVFVLPFLVAMLRDRRWALATLYGVAYGAAGLICILWHDIALAVSSIQPAGASDIPAGSDTVPAAFAIDIFGTVAASVTTAGIDMLRFVAWQNPILVPLIYVAFRQRRTLPPVARQLAWGCLLSLPFLFFQGEASGGWGYLPFHGVLGSVVLLSVCGWSALIDDAGGTRMAATRMLAALSVLVVVVGLPLRTVQIGSVVGPLAEAHRHIASLSRDVVLVDQPGIRFGTALVRNDPYLRTAPTIMALQRLTPDQVTALCDRYSVAFVDYYDLARFGVQPVHRKLGGHSDLSGHDRTPRALATSPRCTGD